MKYKVTLIAIAAVATLLLSGCASVPNVDASNQFWKNKKQEVDIAKEPSAQAKADFYPEGAQGLLDVGINELANEDMNKMLDKFNGQPFLAHLRYTFLAALHKHQIKAKEVGVVSLKQLPDSDENASKYAVLNYSVYRKDFGNSDLLTLTVDSLGEVRHYYGFIPLSEPKAICSITGRLVNLKNNKILWRYTSTVIQPIQTPRENKRNFYAAINKAADYAATNLANNFQINAPSVSRH
jgi:hypothetical protein